MLVPTGRADKSYTVTLPLDDWQAIVNTMEYRKAVLIHSSDPSYMVQPIVDSLAMIQGRISAQLYKEIADTTRKK